MRINPGSTDVTVYFYIVQDASATSPGEPVTGLLFSDIETGGSASYARQGAARVDLTLITLASASAAHADGGFILVDDTNMPGLYRCDYPDAAFATGVDLVNLQIVVASANNAVASPIFVDISTQEVNVTELAGVVQSLTDLKDFADAGYDPATNKVEGVKLTDTTTTNTDMRGTDSAALASALATAQADLDIITDTDGVVLGAAGVDLIMDEPLTAGTHNVNSSLGRIIRQLQQNGTYIRGTIFLDTVGGTAGTDDWENGTDSKRVLTLADANTLATSQGLSLFDVLTGSSITFVSSQSGQLWTGSGWALALGGQDVGGSLFVGAAVSGIGTGSSQIKFFDCALNGSTLNPFEAKRCSLGGDLVLQGTTPTDSDYFFHQCFSEIAGTGTPSIDFGAAETDTNVSMRDYSGGIEVKNMGQAGTDTMSLEGDGQLVINANCTGGTIAIRGNFTITDNSGGAVTISDDARYDVTQVEDSVWDAQAASHNTGGTTGRQLLDIPATTIRQNTAQGPGTGNNQIQFDTGASAVDGNYDPAMVVIKGGTGIDQARNILQYDGASKTATVDRNWKVNPDATSEFVIIADTGREHVNEGLAQGGTANTITLNTLASSIDDAYVGQIVFVRSGTGDDQVGTVIAYNGTTKVATVDRNWGTTPDTTSAYSMLPSSPVELTGNAVDMILDEPLAGHTTAGTLGKAIADTEADAAAIKAKTDDLTYTKANELDINVQSVNDVTVNGTGANGDEWGP